MGAYPPATDMRSLPIVRKYDKPANVLANFKYYNRYVTTVYCPGYFKYAHKLRQHMQQFYIGRSLPWVLHFGIPWHTATRTRGITGIHG